MALYTRCKSRTERFLSRVGRRGSYLIFLGLLDFLFGWSLVAPVTPTIWRGQYLLLSPSVWGWIWIGVGIFLFQQAFTRVDRFGYVAAVLIKFLWGSVALYDWLHSPIDPRGWVSVVIWYAFAVLTAIVSYWPEHTMPQIGAFNGDDE